MSPAIPSAEGSLLQWIASVQREYVTKLKTVAGRLDDYLDRNCELIEEYGDDKTTKIILELHYWANRFSCGPAVDFKISWKSSQSMLESHLDTLDEFFHNDLKKHLPEAKFDYDLTKNSFSTYMNIDHETLPKARDDPERWPSHFDSLTKIFNMLATKYVKLYLKS
jgi:hypothetical protein